MLQGLAGAERWNGFIVFWSVISFHFCRNHKTDWKQILARLLHKALPRGLGKEPFHSAEPHTLNDDGAKTNHSRPSVTWIGFIQRQQLAVTESVAHRKHKERSRTWQMQEMKETCKNKKKKIHAWKSSSYHHYFWKGIRKFLPLNKHHCVPVKLH